MSNNNRKVLNWKFCLGLLLSGLFIYLTFRKINLLKTWNEILSAELSPLLLAIVIMLFLYIVQDLEMVYTS